MIKKTFFSIFALCGVALLLSGCSKDDKWGAVCHIYLDNLPPEYHSLAENLRNDTEIYLSLDNSSTDRHYSIRLTEKNKYTQDVSMLPGSYSVSSVYVINKGLSPIEAVTQVQSVELIKNTQTELAVSLADPTALAQMVEQNKPTPEILSESLYSRKVQYAGAVIDLANIHQVMQFSAVENKRLSAGEVYYIPSESHKGVFMIVKNTTNATIPVMEGSFIGVRFSNNNAVFPTGAAVGSSLEEIANEKTGLLGTPSYCLGTPLIGMGLEKSTLVYLDEESGDRISFEFDPDSKFVNAVSYEFERYE